MVLTALSEATVKKAAGPFKLELQNVGLLLAAFDFGSTPPLDGGGVFGWGVVYGGIKFQVHPRSTMSADFRETWSRSPQFITDGYTQNYFAEGYTSTIDRSQSTHSRLRQQRFALGAAFTF